MGGRKCIYSNPSNIHTTYMTYGIYLRMKKLIDTKKYCSIAEFQTIYKQSGTLLRSTKLDEPDILNMEIAYIKRKKGNK